MSTAPSNLIEALDAADMLEIDGLHAWQFSLDDERLHIECMDGRQRRHWQFSRAAVLAATFDSADESWQLSDEQGPHRLMCFAALGADDGDEPAQASDEPV